MSKKLLMNNGGMNNRLKVRYTTTLQYKDNNPEFNSDFVYESLVYENSDGKYTKEIYSDYDFTSVKFKSTTKPLTIDYLAITNNVTSMYEIFYNCSTIKYINSSNWDTSSVTDMSNMFYGCTSLTEIKGIEEWDVHKVTTISTMFTRCSSLKSLDLSKWNIGDVTQSYMLFYNCKKLESIKLFNLNIARINVLSNIFYRCESLKSLDLTPWQATSVESWDLNINSFFSYCSSLTEIKGIENWNFKVEDMSSTFQGCSSLTSLDLSKLDTSKLNTLEYTFSNCTSLTSLGGDISSWDTHNVTNMGGLFGYCSSLELPSLAQWYTSSVTNMSEMFAGRSNQSINSLVIENWNTSSVTNMSWMFYGCVNGWYDLHLNWDTCNVTDMSNMFNRFYDVQDIYINNWDTSNLSDASNMFLDCQTNSITVSPDFPYTEEDTGYSSYFIRVY